MAEIDVSTYGHINTRTVYATELVSGSRGALDRSLALRATSKDAPGSTSAVLTYDGADNKLEFTSTTGTMKITGCDAEATDGTDLVNLSALIARGLVLPVRMSTFVTLPGAVYNNGTAGVGASLTGAAPFPTLDGITLTVGERILVQSQNNTWENGIYILTANAPGYVLVRTGDFDTPAKMPKGAVIFIREGGFYGGTAYSLNTVVTTVGVSPLTFLRYSHLPPTIETCTDVAYNADDFPEEGDILAFTAAGTWETRRMLKNMGSLLTAGQIPVRSAATATMVGVTPPVLPIETDVLTRVNNGTTNLRFENIFRTIGRNAGGYFGTVYYENYSDPIPTGGFILAGLRGTVIPISNFFTGVPAANISFDGASDYIQRGGDANVGLKLGDTTELAAGDSIYARLQWSVSFGVGILPIAPLICSVAIRETNTVTTNVTIYPQSAVSFSFDRVGLVSLTGPPLLVTINGGEICNYDLVIVIRDMIGDPAVFMYTYQIIGTVGL